MVSRRQPSSIDRSPRAPVLRSIARRATARNASLRNSMAVLSISNMRSYCLVSAFLGSVRIRMSCSSSSSWRVATIGIRPTNSGMSP